MATNDTELAEAMVIDGINIELSQDNLRAVRKLALAIVGDAKRYEIPVETAAKIYIDAINRSTR